MGVVLIVTLAFGLITALRLALLMASKFVGCLLAGIARLAVDLRRLFATIAACIAGRCCGSQTPFPGSSRLFQEPERRRVYLSLTELRASHPFIVTPRKRGQGASAEPAALDSLARE
jgi:hypothetical protein